MFARGELSAEQRVWADVLYHMIKDAIDGPCVKPGAEHADEVESRRISHDQIVNMDTAFVFCCNALGLDHEIVAKRYIAGHITRDDVEALHRAVTRD